MTANRAEWFRNAKWGVIAHFLAAPPDSPRSSVSAEDWNSQVDAFDVEKLASQLEEAKAGYFMITIGQNTGHYCSPNATYDAITGVTPSKCSRRDLVSDLHAALSKRGIPLMAYLPSNAPMGEAQAVKALGFIPCWDFSRWSPPKGVYTQKDCEIGDERLTRGQRNWEAIIREWSLRWGSKVKGWWFDGCYFSDRMYRNPKPGEPSFKSFAAAARAGNPDSIIAWNSGVNYPVQPIDPEADYTAGEANEPWRIEAPGRLLGSEQFHVMSFLGSWWGTRPVRFAPDEAAAHTKAVVEMDGVFTWDVPVASDGAFSDDSVGILKAIGAAVAVSRETPPLRLPSVAIKAPERPLLVDSQGEAEGRIELQVSNPWSQSLRGSLKLDSSSLAISNGGELAYFLSPGESADFSVPVKVPCGARPGKICFSLMKSPATRPLVQRFPAIWSLELEDLDSSGAFLRKAAAEELLSGVVFDNSCADLAMAEAQLAFIAEGRSLGLSVNVTDSVMEVCEDRPWLGSCLELFLSKPGTGEILQFFLVPGTPQRPAAVLRNCSGSWLPLKAELLEFERTASGYRLDAVMPFRELLGCDSAMDETLLFELGVTCGIDGRFRRGRLFGNDAPSSCGSSLARLAIRKPALQPA